MTNQPQREGEKLCTSCGLCCQGVFHPYANIYSSEDLDVAGRIQATIVETQEDSPPTAFSLPCPAFKGKCSVYPERPSVCKAHKCDLLSSLLTDDISLEGALAEVESLKEQLRKVLPTLHELSGNKLSNQPEKLLGDILDSLAKGPAREAFKRENAELLMHFGIFKMISDSTFYRSNHTMKPE